MSDAHANPAALERAVGDAEKRKCEKYIFLGDATGYGYDAEKTVRDIRNLFDVALLGNHDAACVGLDRDRRVRENHHYDIDRAQGKMLDRDLRRWIKELPITHEEGGFVAAHGDFITPREWSYVFDAEEAWMNFRMTSHDLMFCGHSHHASVWRTRKTRNGAIRDFGMAYELAYSPERQRAKSRTVRLESGIRYIVNPGSVGYPRNDGCASYAIYDSDAKTVTFRLLPFDYDSYVDRMVANDLPVPDWVAETMLGMAEK